MYNTSKDARRTMKLVVTITYFSFLPAHVCLYSTMNILSYTHRDTLSLYYKLYNPGSTNYYRRGGGSLD